MLANTLLQLKGLRKVSVAFWINGFTDIGSNILS